VLRVSEERMLILQMITDGKISPEEAEQLLEAIDETERETLRTTTEQVDKREPLTDFGHVIDQVVNHGVQRLDTTLRRLELHLDQKLANGNRLVRRSEREVERAVERAERDRERAERDIERAARDMERAERDRWRAEYPTERILKVGVNIDKVTVEREERLTTTAQPGACFVLDNKVGDVHIAFYDGDTVQVQAKKVCWGSDEEDADHRASATKLMLINKGRDVVLVVARPDITGIGILSMQDTRLDCTVMLPQGLDLNVYTKVGILVVKGATSVASWQLGTKVGDVQVAVPVAVGFGYQIKAKIGHVAVNVPGAKGSAGQVGDGAGRIEIVTHVGDVRLSAE
jgi:hypothetical protein